MTLQHLSRSRLRLLRRIAWITVFASLSMFTVFPIQAATIDVACDVAELVNAVNTANSNGEADTINLAAGCTYFLPATLTVDADGGNPLTVNGNGASLDGNNAMRVLVVSADAVLNLDAVTVTNGNTFDVGSGILNNGGTLTLTNSAVIGNTTSGDGGGIFNDGGTLTLTNTNVDGNSSGGGGISNNGGSVTLTDSTVSLNNAALDGGGIVNNGGTLTLTDSTVSLNNATFDGGGIFNRNGGSVTLNDSTVSLNSGGNFGGGIFNDGGAVTLTNSALTVNDADSGGAIYNLNGGAVILTSSTLSGNSARSMGGAIYNLSDSYVTLSNDTLANNGAGSGGGIANEGSFTLSNSIVADSILGGDCYNTGTITTSGTNLIEDGSCGTGGTLTGDAHLLALTGSPAYHPLHPFSPAIDSGDSSLCPSTDQRGASRPLDGNGDGISICDLGAWECPCIRLSLTPVITFAPGTRFPTLPDVRPSSTGEVPFATDLPLTTEPTVPLPVDPISTEPSVSTVASTPALMSDTPTETPTTIPTSTDIPTEVSETAEVRP